MLTRVGVVVVVVMALLAPQQVLADEPAAPSGFSVRWDAPVTAETGTIRTPVATVTIPEGGAPRGYVAVVEQGGAAGWTELQRASTPRVEQRLRVHAGTTQLRVRLLVDDQEVAQDAIAVTGTAARVTTTLTMPRSAKDYQRTPTTITVRRVHDGKPLDVSVRLRVKRKGSATWHTYRTIRTGSDGVKKMSLLLRHDNSFRALSSSAVGVQSGRSSVRTFDNRPPGAAVVLPKGASRPSISLPAQPRAARVAADARVSGISDAVWRSMKGRTWRAGCPVGRSGLRIVRVSYWAFDGYVRRGEIVVRASAARRTARVFTDLFRAKVPIRSMYRVDRFGYSKTLRGGNDYRSMASDNTSGFNCRHVVGQPGTLSPHAYGGSIDVNPWENPFRSRIGYKPNAGWAKRVHPVRVTYRTTGDPVVRIFRRHGFRWLGFADLQHFQD